MVMDASKQTILIEYVSAVAEDHHFTHHKTVVSMVSIIEACKESCLLLNHPLFSMMLITYGHKMAHNSTAFHWKNFF